MGANTYTYYPSADGSGTAGRWSVEGSPIPGAYSTTHIVINGTGTVSYGYIVDPSSKWVSTVDGLYRERLDGTVACGECPT